LTLARCNGLLVFALFLEVGMLHMGWFWLKQRWRGISAVGIAALVVVLALVLALSNSGNGISFLGDFNAARPAAAGRPSGAVLPRSGVPVVSLLDTDLPTSAGPQTVADAQAAWSADELAQHQQEVLAAINCARAQQGQRALTLDETISHTASDAWLTLIHHPSWSLMQLPGRYALRSVLSLDFASPDQIAAQAQQSAATQHAPSGCVVGGFDAASLTPSPDAHRVGIAVFPPQAAWDSASAIVLVK
jgi:hypothetical protein